MEINNSPNKVAACLFDLDGVLVDTAVYHFQAWRRLARQLGFDFTEEQNEQLKGISRMESLAKILSWGGVRKSEAEAAALAAQKNEWYVEMISNMTPAEVLPGARAFLEAARASGMRTALGSASKNATLILERTGLAALLDGVVDGNSVARSKPDPEVFISGARLLGVDASQCVVFEDAVAGIEAAQRAGMRSVGIGDPVVLHAANICVPDLERLTPGDLEKL